MFVTRSGLILFVFFLTCFAGLQSVAAKEDSSRELFEQYKSLILQVKILYTASGKKSSIGTGFLVKQGGYIVTNYHVVADLLLKPQQYNAVYITESGKTGQLKVVSVDVVHDLALLKADLDNQAYFEFNPEPIQKGTEVYSLGNPRDLGFVILSGNHGGLVEPSLYEKIHFIGALEPGMSGGPSFTVDGKVVGVNVATAGNLLSFLVPSKHVVKMLEDARSLPQNLLVLAQQQLQANQSTYMSDFIRHPIKTTRLGRYRVPDKLSETFRCWGGDVLSKPKPYQIIEQSCESKDDIFLNEDHSTGTVSYKHLLISSDKLDAFKFYTLFEAKFSRLLMAVEGREEDVTNFSCQEKFVVNHGLHLKVVYCARGYKKFFGLYDVVLKAATVDQKKMGLQTALLLTGVSFQNAQQFAKKYLDSITWQQ
ncbi:MAG: trypsin-like peptidase domain-containing protein [Methylococcales bacterium]|nr:trypsin-like peptidase domain-containing protein [Methylococcales bacterium]MBT7443344.1 trypsin-like peptidase domain-containing protein [Methylococcales bacterium]